MKKANNHKDFYSKRTHQEKSRESLPILEELSLNEYLTLMNLEKDIYQSHMHSSFSLTPHDQAKEVLLDAFKAKYAAEGIHNTKSNKRMHVKTCRVAVLSMFIACSFIALCFKSTPIVVNNSVWSNHSDSISLSVGKYHNLEEDSIILGVENGDQ